MKRYTSYLKYVLRHKWFVFLACFEMRVPIWIAILHDWDKFLPDEFIPYARCFYKPDGSKQYKEAFLPFAWNHHQKRNKHHWQYWLLTWDRGETVALEMPDLWRREMIADWIGAGKALGKPDTLAWYEANKDKMILHPKTHEWVKATLERRQEQYYQDRRLGF